MLPRSLEVVVAESETVAAESSGWEGLLPLNDFSVFLVEAGAKSSASKRVRAINSLMDLWKAGLSTAQSDGQIASSTPREFDLTLL